MTAVDLVAVGLRALSFVAALQAAGLALFLWLFGDHLQASLSLVRALAARTAVAGLLLTIAHQIVEPARVVGSIGGIFDGALQSMLLASDAGTATAVRALGLALTASAWIRPSRLGKPSRVGAATALIGGTLIVASFTFMGHTATDDQRWLLASLLIIHLLIVAFWFGALWPMHIAARYEELGTTGAIAERFSVLAVWLVPLIFLAGLAMSALLLPSLASLVAPYGLLLLAKVAGFALLMALASLNKWRLGPQMSRGHASASGAFRRSVLTEWVLISIVLVVTAVMTALFSPAH